MARLLAATERGLHAVGGGPVELGDREVTGLVVEGERRWAIVDGDEIVSSADGQRWTTKAQTDGSFRCLLPTAEGALVGTDGAHLLRLGPSGAEPVVGFDKAPGREEWYTPWGGPPDTRSLSAEAGALYANVHVGGILRSR